MAQELGIPSKEFLARELGISSEESLAKTLQTAQSLGIKGEVLETISYIHQIVTIPREEERKAQKQRRTEELARFEAAKNMQN